MSILFHYPPKYPFYVVEYNKEKDYIEFETFDKLDLNYLKNKFKKGTIYKITKNYKDKNGQNILIKLNKENFNHSTKEIKIG